MYSRHQAGSQTTHDFVGVAEDSNAATRTKAARNYWSFCHGRFAATGNRS